MCRNAIYDYFRFLSRRLAVFVLPTKGGIADTKIGGIEREKSCCNFSDAQNTITSGLMAVIVYLLPL